MCNPLEDYKNHTMGVYRCKSSRVYLKVAKFLDT